MKNNSKIKPSILEIITSRQRKVLQVLLLAGFVASVLGRLSIIPDYFVQSLGVALFSRLMTKSVWLIVFGVLLVVAGVYLIKAKQSYANVCKEFWVKNKWLILIGAMIIISAIVSFVFAQQKVQPFYGVVYYMLLIGQMFGAVMLWDLNLYTLWRKINYVLVAVLLLVGLVQLLAYAQGGVTNPIIQLFDKYGGYTPISAFILVQPSGVFLRPSSLMTDPNFMGMFVALVILLAISDLIMQHKNRKYEILPIVAIVSSVVLIFITNSRTAVGVLVLGLITYTTYALICRARYKKPMVSRLTSIVWFDSIIQRLQQGLNLSDGSSQEHLQFISGAITIFKSHPFTGVGIGNYPYYYQLLVDATMSAASPHSAYFRTLAELGLLGLFVLTIFILYFVGIVLRSGKALLVALLVALLAGSVFYDALMIPWVMFYLGVIYAESKLNTQTK